MLHKFGPLLSEEEEEDARIRRNARRKKGDRVTLSAEEKNKVLARVARIVANALHACGRELKACDKTVWKKLDDALHALPRAQVEALTLGSHSWWGPAVNLLDMKPNKWAQKKRAPDLPRRWPLFGRKPRRRSKLPDHISTPHMASHLGPVHQALQLRGRGRHAWHSRSMRGGGRRTVSRVEQESKHKPTFLTKKLFKDAGFNLYTQVLVSMVRYLTYEEVMADKGRELAQWALQRMCEAQERHIAAAERKLEDVRNLPGGPGPRAPAMQPEDKKRHTPMMEDQLLEKLQTAKARVQPLSMLLDCIDWVPNGRPPAGYPQKEIRPDASSGEEGEDVKVEEPQEGAAETEPMDVDEDVTATNVEQYNWWKATDICAYWASYMGGLPFTNSQGARVRKPAHASPPVPTARGGRRSSSATTWCRRGSRGPFASTCRTRPTRREARSAASKAGGTSAGGRTSTAPRCGPATRRALPLCTSRCACSSTCRRRRCDSPLGASGEPPPHAHTQPRTWGRIGVEVEGIVRALTHGSKGGV